MEKPSILIVDDNKLNLDLLTSLLHSDYNIRIARNGEECIKRSLVVPYPDLILLDIMMPVLDGYATIEILKKNELTRDIPVIFLTALSEKDEIVKGFQLGAVDYLTKPFNITELKARVNTHLELKRSREEIEAQKLDVEKLNTALSERLEEQRMYIAKARILQENLIQKSIPILDDFAIQALYLPCEDLGGDFFKIIRGISENKLIIVIGDCTGHGVQASIDASLLTRVIRKNMEELFNIGSTSVFLQNVNIDLMEIAEEDKFPTMFVCILDLVTRELTYSNANGVLPNLLRGKELTELQAVEGMHLGYSPDSEYRQASLKLEDGDRLYLYSDAVLEFGSEKIKHSGRKKFESLLLRDRGCPSGDFRAIISDLEEAAGHLPLEDDTTFIQIDFEPVIRNTYKFSSMDEYADILENIRRIMKTKDFDREEIAALSIGLDEMCLNAHYHGNREDLSKSVFIDAEISFKSAKFRITDMGEGFRPSEIRDPVENIVEIYNNPDPEVYAHGRGLEVVKLLYDSVEFNDKGNSVLIKKSKERRNVLFFNKIK